MRIADPYVEELRPEAPTTRRVLKRVPEAHLDWRPHAKSMSLGQLALHVATLPRQLIEFVTGDALDFSAAGSAPPTVSSHQELLAAFASSTEQAQSYPSTPTDERASATWRLMAGSREWFAAPRAAVLRSLLFNHWYHNVDSFSSTCDSSTCPCHRSTAPLLMRTRSRRRIGGASLENGARRAARESDSPGGSTLGRTSPNARCSAASPSCTAVACAAELLEAI
jgi:hypothetical protein